MGAKESKKRTQDFGPVVVRLAWIQSAAWLVFDENEIIADKTMAEQKFLLGTWQIASCALVYLIFIYFKP